MIKALGSIFVGDIEYKPGQTVKGLSGSDVAWLKEQGLIEETAEPKKKTSPKKAEKDEL